MKYMGSKNRIAKHILPIILKEYKEGMMFLDATVGGGNFIDKLYDNDIIDIPPDKIYGNDYNEYLIEMWKAVSKGWTPPKLITEEDYQNIKQNKDEDKPLTAYVGFALSYGGKWFGGYRRDVAGTKENPELKLENEKNQSRRSYNNIVTQLSKLKDVTFFSKNILDIKPTQPTLIYCDPPYKGTTKYKNSFDHDKFYDWCRQMKKDGHTIFISEYDMPDDFKCVWSKEITSSLTKNTGAKKGLEKLFTL